MRVQERVSPFAFNEPQFSCSSTIRDTINPPPKTREVSENEKRSFDFLSRIEKKLAQYNASESILKRWLFELLSVTTSAACMGAIIGILCYLDDQSLNKWPLGLTVITVLSKIASAALILPISEAIGQLKWTWFHGEKSRDAFDFEIFDKASRGAWGSFMLLCRTKGRSLAALGALLTVFLLAIDTFFQQVTDLPERSKLKGESFIPRVVHYEPIRVFQYDSSWDNDVPLSQPNLDLKAVIAPYFYEKNGTHPLKIGNATQAEISLVCPTGRCEWPPYQTLGICSACEDVSDVLEYACLTMRLDWIKSSTGAGTDSTWPNGTACGYFLNATSTNPVLMSGFRVENGTRMQPGETLLMRTLPLVTNPLRDPFYNDGTIKFKNITHPLLDALIVSSADGTPESVYRKEPPVAQECILAWCVKTLRSSYASGDYVEQTESTFMNTTPVAWPWWTREWTEDNMVETEFRANISILPPSLNGSAITFGTSNETVLDMVEILDEIFPSSISVSNATAPQLLKIRNGYQDRVIFRDVLFNPWIAPNNVTNHMERLAQSITNALRSDIHSNELIPGAAYEFETFVAVHWPWMTFPLFMLLMSIIFLIATMYKTSKDDHGEIGVWKTSAMPTLMYGLPKKTQMDIMSDTTTRGVAGRGASKVRIRLHPKQGWRVSGASHLSTSPQLPRPVVHVPHGWI